MSVEPELAGVPPTLSPAQHTRWAAHPDLPRRAVAAVVAELGEIEADEAMLAVAERGALEAAASFDPGRGLDYEQWALFYTASRLWEWLRRAHGQDKALLARIREAMFRFLAHDCPVHDPWTATRERSQAAVRSFSDGLLFSALVSAGASAMSVQGDEDMVKIEAARRAGEALRVVVGELRPEQVWLLDRCHGYDETVKEAAKEMGKGYRAVLRDYHELLGRMGARLDGLGVKEMPPWLPEVSGRALCEPDEPANDGGEG